VRTTICGWSGAYALQPELLAGKHSDSDAVKAEYKDGRADADDSEAGNSEAEADQGDV